MVVDYTWLMTMELAGKRVTVMGLGRFGGGVGVTRWLVSQGADVLVTDLQPAEKLAEPIADIQDLLHRGSAQLRLGEHNVSDFTTCDLVIANPAVPKPWENRFIRSAIAAGIPVTTEIRLLTERINRRKTIGITGSAGKSTTTAMIHHLLAKSGHRAHLGGNIGGSLLNELDQIRADDWIVLELSSAMLHWLGEGVGYSEAKGWSPHIAVLTNINPNHIDWHGSFEHYRESKNNIFKHQRHDEGDCQITEESLDHQSSPIPLRIPGAHNQVNARMALIAVERALRMPARLGRALLVDFAGLPHRLQLVGESDGLRFYNDSKSTTPQATVLAVQAFDDPSRIHLIAGGYDKGSDLIPIAELSTRIAGLYTIGKTGKIMADRARGGHSRYCETLEAAIDEAMHRMRRGDVLLLSPGCASWDQFINFEQRGEEFVRMLRAHLQSVPASPH